MSDKVRQMTNKVVLAGKVAELEVRKGVTEKKVPYISVKGAIQFGEHKAMTRNFEKFVQEYSIKEDGSHKKNKAYPKVVEWADNAVSIAKSSYEAATEVSIQGTFATNDYINKENKLVEALKVDAAFFNEVGDDYKATADIEGYIQTITPETKGEDQTETGRLRVTILTNDFFGNIIPVKNIIVPAELRDDFEDGYEVGQTAKVFIDFVLHEGEAKPKKSGGIGVQRTTDGASYVEMILTGADSAIDEDDENAYSKEAVKIGLAERETSLKTIKDNGYQGNSGSSNRNSIGGATTKPKTQVTEEELPF